MEKVKDYISRIDLAIDKAVRRYTKLTAVEFDVMGMASFRNRVLLNNLIKEGDRYLEIGVWLGSTFVAALYGNKYANAIAIDNFSEFGKESEIKHTPTGNSINPSAALFHANAKKSGILNYCFIEADCFKLNPRQKEEIKDVNVYFYDGGHTDEDQCNALTYYIDNLADVFIFVVDDWNHPPAKTGTRRGIKETNLIIHQEWELKTPEEKNQDAETWWNGLYIAVCEKPKV